MQEQEPMDTADLQSLLKVLQAEANRRRLLERPETGDPWHERHYQSNEDETQKSLSLMNSRDICMSPWDVGEMAGGVPRKLAYTLGLEFMDSHIPNRSFAWMQGEGESPSIVMPKFEVGAVIFRTANTALLHYTYKWLWVSAGLCTCCTLDEMWLNPTNPVTVAAQMAANYDKKGTLPNHFWETTVWARVFSRSNRLYTGRMAGIVAELDRKNNFWMPNFREIGEKRRTESLWKRWSGHDEVYRILDTQVEQGDFFANLYKEGEENEMRGRR